MLVSFLVFCIFLTLLSWTKVWDKIADYVIWPFFMFLEAYLTRPIFLVLLIVWLLFVLFPVHLSLTFSPGLKAGA